MEGARPLPAALALTGDPYGSVVAQILRVRLVPVFQDVVFGVVIVII